MAWKSCLLICDPMLVELGFAEKHRFSSSLELTLFKDVRPNPDTDTVKNAYDMYVTSGAQYIFIGFGGGSSIDTAKAIEDPISQTLRTNRRL
ncbi:iron-containing alcohol dehydrogenase [Vibrio sp. M60_M31a]